MQFLSAEWQNDKQTFLVVVCFTVIYLSKQIWLFIFKYEVRMLIEITHIQLQWNICSMYILSWLSIYLWSSYNYMYTHKDLNTLYSKVFKIKLNTNIDKFIKYYYFIVFFK